MLVIGALVGCGTAFSEDSIMALPGQTSDPSGDGAFVLKGLTCGDYAVRLSCRDAEGRVSRTVWNDFRVRTAAELAVTEAQTERPSVADLAKFGAVPDLDGFYRIEPVELADGVAFPVGFREATRLNGKEAAREKAAIRAAITNAVAAAIASEAGKALVAARPEGYVVFAPAKHGHFIYRCRDHRVVVPGARHDAAATEARAKATSQGLTKYLAERAAAGVRKIILPKATWRLSTEGKLLVPSGLTLDLSSGKLKLNATKVTAARPIQFFRTQDTHLVNGEIEGCYFEYDYEHCGTGNPEHIGTFMM